MQEELLKKLEIIDYKLLNEYINRSENLTYCKKVLPYFEETLKFADIILTDTRFWTFNKKMEYSSYISPQEAIDLSRDFFQSISYDYANRFLNILNDGTVKFEYREYDAKAHNRVDKDGNVHIFLEGTIKDVYIIVHEMIHKFSQPHNQASLLKLFLSESTSLTSEYLVYSFLHKSNIVVSEYDLMISILNYFSLWNKYAAILKEEYKIYQLYLENGSLNFSIILDYIHSNGKQENDVKIILSTINQIFYWKRLSYFHCIRYIIGTLIACSFYSKVLDGKTITLDFEKLVSILGEPDWKNKESMEILRNLDIPLLKDDIDIEKVTNDYHKVLNLFNNRWNNR